MNNRDLIILLIPTSESLLLGEEETPLAEHIFRVGIRRCKEAVYLDSFINNARKTEKFSPMHLLADEFVKPALEPGLLCGA